MKQYGKIVYWGMAISFLGSLPPGIINLVAVQVAGTKGYDAAIGYALGSMLAEIIIVRVALTGMGRITRNQKFFHLVEWITAGLLVLFSLACFIGADRNSESPVILPSLLLSPFLTGFVLSAINPLHIPFWLGWTTVLMNKEVLAPRAKHYNFYITGIGAGTMAGFMVFIFAGQQLLKLFQSNQYFINCVAGIALFIMAFFYIRKMIRVPAATRHARLFKQS